MKAILSKFFAWFAAGVVAFFMPIFYSFVMVLFLVIGTSILKSIRDKYVQKEFDDKGVKSIKLRYKFPIYICFMFSFRAAQYVWPQYPILNMFLSMVVGLEIWIADCYFKDLTGYSFISKAKDAVKKFKNEEKGV